MLRLVFNKRLVPLGAILFLCGMLTLLLHDDNPPPQPRSQENRYETVLLDDTDSERAQNAGAPGETPPPSHLNSPYPEPLGPAMRSPVELGFSNIEIGDDPDREIHFDFRRIEDLSTPGPYAPAEGIGIDNAPPIPPDNVPPPPGTYRGEGGAPILDVGKALRKSDLAGGYVGGLEARPGGFGGRSGATRRRPPQPENRRAIQQAKVWRRGGQRPTFARVDIGGGNVLELVSLRVSVVIDGPRARTFVDHVFRNPHPQQLEGTLEYPLPTDASPSYFAMFLGQTRGDLPPLFAKKGKAPPLPADKLAQLTPQELVKHVDVGDWGNLQESRVVSRKKALETYENIVRRRIDPALLEHAGGNTFRGRVFPIPANGYNRVLIAYEELLPQSQGLNQYRFPLPNCELGEVQFTLQVKDANGQQLVFEPKAESVNQEDAKTIFHKTWKNTTPKGEVSFAFKPENPGLEVISGSQGQQASQYVYARVRPQLEANEQNAFSDRAVFLLDTSMSTNGKRFDSYVKLMQQILECDPDLKWFKILTFDVATAWVEPKGWMPNTAQGRELALNRLDGILLEGATNWSAALKELAKPIVEVKKDDPLNVFVLSDGSATWGKRDMQSIVSRFTAECNARTQFHCYRFGIGAENLELFRALTRQGGGIFQCHTEQEIKTAALGHRRHCWQIENVSIVGLNGRDVLIAGRKQALYPGGELIVAGQVDSAGKAVLRLEGTFQGEKLVRTYPIEVKGSSELAARGWGEIAVASLLALNDPNLDNLVTAYCQQFNVGSRVASFLVLEDERDYKRLNLEKERGLTVKGDLNDELARMWLTRGKERPAREELMHFLTRVDSRLRLFEDKQGNHVLNLLALLDEEDVSLPEVPLIGRIRREKDVSKEYLKVLASHRASEGFIAEAERRERKNDRVGAIRALSSIVEINSGRSESIRLVGYSMMAMEQYQPAVHLFEQVQRRRPFEPQAYLNLARCLEAQGKFGWAALQYEIVLRGQWHGRFGDSPRLIARDEYRRLLARALSARQVKGQLADHFVSRLKGLGNALPANDLEVTISWSTDASDVDLWVIEPDGTKCFYSHPTTKNGGRLTQDLTQGFGPERYHVQNAHRGEYSILVNHFSGNANRIGEETHVEVRIRQYAGTSRERVVHHVVVLRNSRQTIKVTKLKY